MLDVSQESRGRSEVCKEIADINGEFLALLTHPAVQAAETVLGLPGGVVAGLSALDNDNRRTVAQAPVLLAEFQPFPGFDEVRDESCEIRTLLAATLGSSTGNERQWRAELEGFANRLLTCVWQTARRDPLLTALFVGIDSQRAELLAQLDFAQISRYARESVGALRVRLADHPHFWPDLIRLARSGNAQQQAASRLSALQLSAADCWPGRRSARRDYEMRLLAGR